MILAADVGVGIVGLEGMQASLAADFSTTQFSHILPLLLWHGRNAYKRSARLSQFVIHRGGCNTLGAIGGSGRVGCKTLQTVLIETKRLTC